MCGIAGMIRLDGTEVDPDQLDHLTDAVAHRGPEMRGVHLNGPVGLGHRRLKIIDLSEAASQPMYSDDKQYVIVFNGEIYNYQEKRRELEASGHTFRSQSDTEVLLKLYEVHGKECLQHLRGQFAFAIHDRKHQRVFLARDRVGKKPIKYFRANGVFAFASELKALRTLPQCPNGIDAEAVHHFLTMMYVPSPRTGIEGIQKLPAAHSLTIDLKTGAETIERYWQLNYDTDKKTSAASWKEQILSTLEESVRLRMIADVPLGAFLSGGLDSATVVALMSKQSSSPVKTFSIGTQQQTHNELPDAAIVAKHFGTDHHPIVVEPDIVHLLPKLVHTYEEPYADSSAIPTYLLAQIARNDVTVALNGDGGDENFGGYVRYPILRFSQQWARVPFVHGLARLCTGVFHSVARSTLSYRMQRFQQTINLPWERRYLQYLSFFTEEEKRSLYAKGFGEHFPRTDVWYDALTHEARGRAHDLVHKAMSMDIDTYLADDLLPKVDLGSMAHALEARSPLLDHELLELTARMPMRYKVQGWHRKVLFRDILKDILPAEMLAKKKRGFRLPLDHWFRNDLQSFVSDRLLTRDPAFHGIIDRQALAGFLKNYHASSVDYSDHVWALLWLSEWLRQYH